LNIECGQQALDELTTNFRYNDAVLRNMVIRRDAAVTDESSIMKAENEDRRRKADQLARAPRQEAVLDEDAADDSNEDDAE
jgi:small subunit ribosomal protein S6